ncbi:MAG: preprotein translocase subunit SecG [Candidatus Pacebacteria bacterium]|nr:preprotein translocase subunit SecG [Candidatus Paceibacterota bacterium]
MENLSNLLPYIQIILSILLIAVILLQQSDSGLGGAFGGDDFQGEHTKRGSEKVLFRITIILGILFIISTFLALII